MLYTQEEVEAHLKRLDGWMHEEGRWIVRTFLFSDFMKGIAFVDEVAAISEAFNHHPFITIDYKTVTLRLTSREEGGITGLDFKEAQQYNEAFERMKDQAD
ncbi:4a-hydroxytetrahydrobiopterin dehydratase [Paenibacillus sp. JX-17]|uniref:4a-hydroxytetrahydrobiopterin dehydratase n=1 Tax=Paenibacillus lacisoli TaxID=3064525 RepID=A0ABT9CHF6_9BACL|nr:4a-hydroxytetrahydrobiopterin dehydratase [Paenibacillus sp. JX-17]MDO7908685.1 4a-hydroxytetrahydrobiopterin dehydratase [Paenibacillus sp. JX-17]